VIGSQWSNYFNWTLLIGSWCRHTRSYEIMHVIEPWFFPHIGYLYIHRCSETQYIIYHLRTRMLWYPHSRLGGGGGSTNARDATAARCLWQLQRSPSWLVSIVSPHINPSLNSQRVSELVKVNHYRFSAQLYLTGMVLSRRQPQIVPVGRQFLLDSCIIHPTVNSVNKRS
jgi:hypothetical protein